MNKKNTKFFACLMIIGALFYLLAEFIAISHSLDSFKSYFSHTISDLGVPFNVHPFSQNSSLMKSAFIIDGLIFFLCYYYLFENSLGKKNTFLLSLAFLASVGVIMVGLFHCRCSFIGLHFMGTFLTFSCGNLLLIFTGKFFTHDYKYYKKLSSLLGIIGFICASIIMFNIPFKFVPALERMTIYPILIFQFLTGIIYFKSNKKNH